MNRFCNNKLFGMYLLAILVLSAVGVNGQDSLKAYLDNGVDLMAKKDYQGSLSSYQNALRLDPDNYLAIRNIGVNYAHLNDQKQALTYLERAFKMDPNDAQVCNNLAVVFTSIGNSSEALKYLELAVSIDSTNERYLTNLGQEYTRIGRIGKALPILRRAWILNQKNAIIPYNIGNCFGASEVYDSAEYYYKQSVSLGGRPADLYYRLGTVQNRLGKTLEASESFVEALKRNPDFKECRQSLAMLFMTDRQYTAARKEFEILCNADSNFYPAWIGYGTALAMDGQSEESERILSRLFAIDSALGFQMLKVINLQK